MSNVNVSPDLCPIQAVQLQIDFVSMTYWYLLTPCMLYLVVFSNLSIVLVIWINQSHRKIILSVSWGELICRTKNTFLERKFLEYKAFFKGWILLEGKIYFLGWEELRSTYMKLWIPVKSTKTLHKQSLGQNKHVSTEENWNSTFDYEYLEYLLPFFIFFLFFFHFPPSMD